MIAGGHGYLGTAVCDFLREEGATALPISRRGHHGLSVDANNDESVERAVATVLDEHGRLDGLVVASAPSARTLRNTSSPDVVGDAVAGKALTFLRLANAALPAMRRAGYGRIVGIGGQNAHHTGNIAGSVRNVALSVVAKNVADATLGTGVTVNVVSPGRVNDSPPSTRRKGLHADTTPVDVAAAVAFLLSPLARSISGESIAVGHKSYGSTGF